MRFLFATISSFVFAGVAVAGTDQPGPPPPWFDATEGVVLTTLVSTVPAKLRPGTLGTCKRFASSFDGTVINTCDVTGGTFTVGDGQTIAIKKTQVIEGSKALQNGKPYVVWWFMGEASLPEGAPARLVVTRLDGAKRMNGDVRLTDMGAPSAVVLDVP